MLEDELLSVLLDTAGALIIVLDREGRIVRFNRACEQTTGYTFDEVKDQSVWYFFVPLEELRAFQAIFEQLRSGQFPVQSEIHWVAKDGSHRLIVWTNAVLFDKDDTVKYVVGTGIDITELRQAEAALLESEAFNRAILNSITANIAVLNRNGMITAVNEAWTRFALTNGGRQVLASCGVGANYLAACRQAEGDEASMAQEALAGLQAVLDGAQPYFTLEYPCHSPEEERWCLLHAAPLLTDSGGVVTAHLNITERKQAEIALQESETLLHGIISTATDAIITIDHYQRIILFNIAAAETFGYEANEMIGQPLSLLIPERFQAGHLQYVKQFGQSGIIARSMGTPDQLWGRRANGEEFPIEVMISQVEVSARKFYTAILRDITERKRIEAEKDQLFQAISQQSEQLRALAGRLAELEDAERKQLARELHDQIGQNLTALGLNLNIIRRQISSPLPELDGARTRLDDSLVLVEEMAERVRDVMANLRPPVLDDYGLVAALHWYGKHLAARTGLEVTIDGAEPDPRLAPSIESALFGIVQEALTNVAKHSQATQVNVRIAADKKRVRLAVADNGVGFQAEPLARFTERQGWGLLTMSERAEAVGGWFRLETAPGRGAQVIVEVPR